MPLSKEEIIEYLNLFTSLSPTYSTNLEKELIYQKPPSKDSMALSQEKIIEYLNFGLNDEKEPYLRSNAAERLSVEKKEYASSIYLSIALNTKIDTFSRAQAVEDLSNLSAPFKKLAQDLYFIISLDPNTDEELKTELQELSRRPKILEKINKKKLSQCLSFALDAEKDCELRLKTGEKLGNDDVNYESLVYISIVLNQKIDPYFRFTAINNLNKFHQNTVRLCSHLYSILLLDFNIEI